MKRKVTALLLAMAFVLATVAPTLAAGNEKAAANKTATVSVEKTKSKRGPLAAVVRLLTSKKANADDNDTLKDSENESNDRATAEKKGEEDGSTTVDAKKKFEVPFTVRNEAGEDLDGAILRIVNDENHEVEKEWTSGRLPIKIKLAAGKYSFSQWVPAIGYKAGQPISFEIDAKGNIKSADSHLKKIKDENVLVLVAEKMDSKLFYDIVDQDGKRVIGATLQIKEKGSKDALHEWKSEEGPKAHKLVAGKFELLQSVTPEGYKAAEPIDFEITEDGQISTESERLITKGNDQFLLLKTEKQEENQGTTVTFSIQDIFDNELSGAKLQLKEKDASEPLQGWESEKTPAYYTLEAGKSYEFVQTDAPKGYEKADPIEFTVGENGKVTADEAHFKTVGDHYVLIMKNDFEKAKVFYSVQGFAGNELAGATLRIVKRDGTLVESWTAEKTPKSIKLDAGSYRFELVQGPQGNEVAEAVDFTIFGDGKIEAEEGHLKAFGEKHKMLYLTAKQEESNFYFGLRDILDRELAGGQLQIRDQVTGKVVKEWTSGSAPKGFRLEAGKYTLVQVTAPKGYTVARSVDFEISKEGKIIADSAHLKLFGGRQVLILFNACKNNMVEFSKVTPEGKALSGASLEIYKDTTKLASWTSDAGLYRMEFEPGTYRFHEVAAPQGYKPVSDFEFEVKADGTITLGTIQNGESVALKNGRIIVTDQVDKPAPTENKKPESNTNKDKSYWVEFDVAKKDGTLLDGAVVEIYQNGKLLESWTSSATGYKTKLQPGSYRFHTKTAPKGYQLARDFNFAVNRDGSITLGKLQSGDTVTARNGKITVYGDPVSASGVRTAGTTAQGGNGKLPKTGDGISPVVYAVGLVAVGAVILGIGIKKRRESVDEVK